MAENVQKLKYQNLDIYTQEESIVSIVKTQTTPKMICKPWCVHNRLFKANFEEIFKRTLDKDVNPGDIAVSEKKISILLPVRGLRTLFLRCARACKLTTSGKSSILSSLEKSI
jgi:hypothetical protein